MIVICGGFLAALLGPTGPVTEQFPAMSHKVRLLVKAFAVSVPAGTVVASMKLAGELRSSPDPASLAVQAILTSLACQAPSGDPQLIAGGVLSSCIVRVLAASTLPALSVAKYGIVVTPSPVMFNVAEPAATFVEGIVWAPLSLKEICF